MNFDLTFLAMLSIQDQKFDRLAWVYDFLVKLVFAKNLQKAQCYFLENLPKQGEILIIGGGSGWILNEISKRKPQLKITYVEASFEMIKKARSRKVKNEVRFIHGNEQMLPKDMNVNVLITPFFLDLFGPVRLLATLASLDQVLDKHGIWLFTDFNIPPKGLNRLFGNLLIYVMYRFFRMLCGIDARKLPDFDRAFEMANYIPLNSQVFYFGMIRSMILRKK